MKEKKRTKQTTEAAGEKMQKEKEGKENKVFPFQ